MDLRRLGLVVAAAATMIVAPLALESGAASVFTSAGAASAHDGSLAKGGTQSLRNIQRVADRIPASATTTTAAPVEVPTTVAAPVVTTTTAPHVSVAPVTTAPAAPAAAPAPAPAPTSSETGQGTWYSWNPGQCASPTLPHGTMVTVTNLANGASTSCLITDTEESGWPRIIDMDTSVFSAIAGPQGTGAGVLNVSVSW
jgi:cytoskeletal protein RodZ